MSLLCPLRLSPMIWCHCCVHYGYRRWSDITVVSTTAVIDDLMSLLCPLQLSPMISGRYRVHYGCHRRSEITTVVTDDLMSLLCSLRLSPVIWGHCCVHYGYYRWSKVAILSTTVVTENQRSLSCPLHLSRGVMTVWPGRHSATLSWWGGRHLPQPVSCCRCYSCVVGPDPGVESTTCGSGLAAALVRTVLSANVVAALHCGAVVAHAAAPVDGDDVFDAVVESEVHERWKGIDL